MCISNDVKIFHAKSAKIMRKVRKKNVSAVFVHRSQLRREPNQGTVKQRNTFPVAIL